MIPKRPDNRGVEWGEDEDTLRIPRSHLVTYIGRGGQVVEKNIGTIANADRIMSHRPKGFNFMMMEFLQRWRVYDLRNVRRKVIQNRFGKNVAQEFMLPEPMAEYVEREPAIALALLTYDS